MPSIDTEQNCNTVFDIEAELGICWMDPIISYLRDGLFPVDNGESHRIKAHVARYWLSLDQKLYRRSFSSLYLRCVHIRKVQYVLFVLHEGSCGSHVGGRSLVNKAKN